LIAGAAIGGLRQIYRPGCRLANAEVLLDLQNSSVKQSEFALDDPAPHQAKLMGTLFLEHRLRTQVHPAGQRRRWWLGPDLDDDVGAKTPNCTTCRRA